MVAALLDLSLGGVLSEGAEHIAHLLHVDLLVPAVVEVAEDLATVSQLLVLVGVLLVVRPTGRVVRTVGVGHRWVTTGRSVVVRCV